MRYRVLPVSRPRLALAVFLIALCVSAGPFFSGTAAARWDYLEGRQHGLEGREAQLAAIRRISALADPGEHELDTFTVASLKLALAEPDGRARAGYWQAALNFISKLEERKQARTDHVVVALLELLLALEENPGDPLALYREKIEKRIQSPGYPENMTFALYNQRTGYLLDFAAAVPADMQQRFYRALFDLTGQLTLEDKGHYSSDDLGPSLKTMFACLAESPAAEQAELLDKTYALLEEFIAANKARKQDRASPSSAYLGMSMVDFIRLALGSLEGFNLKELLAEDDNNSLLGLMNKARAGIAPGAAPQAGQRELLDRASANLCRAYSGSDYSRHYLEPLKTRLVSMLLARYPDNVKLVASQALTLSDDWDSSTRRYSGNSLTWSYEGLPLVSDLIARAEALNPDDLVLLKTKMIVNYKSFSYNRGGALAAEIFLKYKVGCLESLGDSQEEAWDAWSGYDLSYNIESVDIEKLAGDFSAFGKRCPAFGAFGEFTLREAARKRSSEPGKQETYEKSQIALLEKALSHSPPAKASSILYARLGDLTAPYQYNNALSEREKADALERTIKAYESSLAFWPGDKRAFPANSALAELYSRAVKSAEIRLTGELLAKIRSFSEENIWNEGVDRELLWANYLFTQAAGYELRKTPEKAEFLRQQGFIAYRGVNRDQLREADWTAWAQRLEQQAERENKLLDADVLKDIHDKLERALAFNPLGVSSNKMLSETSLTIMAGTPPEEWGDLAGKAYARFALPSGLPPAGARAFDTWSQALHQAAARVENYARSAGLEEPGQTEKAESVKAVRLLAERFAAAALLTVGERRDFLAALYPEALQGVPPARPFPETPAALPESGDVYAFRAALLPRLINAGFAVPEDFQALEPSGQAIESYYYRPRSSVLAAFAEPLEAFRAFPETGARLEAVLFAEDLPLELRVKWFFAVTPPLCKLSFSLLKDSHRYSAPDQPAKIKKSMAIWYSPDLGARDNDGLSREQLLTAADFLLARYLDFIEEESPIGFIAWAQREKRPYVRAWPEEEINSSWRVAEGMDIWQEAESAGNLLARHWHNDEFRAKAVQLLSSGKSRPSARLKALYIISVSPSENLDDALASAPYSSGIDSFASCWGWMRDSFSYGLTPGGCGDNLLEVLNQRAQSGPRIVSAAQRGPGIRLTKLDAPPASFAGRGPLYLLYVGRSALPEWLQPHLAEGHNALAGTLLVGMDGPRIVSVDPDTDDGAVLLNWAASVGSPAGEAIIIASDDEPEALARRIASWHLSTWEQEPGEASFVFNKPCNGSFLRARLPLLKGQAASLFMGREQAIWFASPAVGGADWYLAEPEPGVEPLPASSLPYSLEISHEHILASGEVFSEDFPIYYSNQLAFEKPKPGRDAVFARNFYAEAEKELMGTPATEDMDLRERRQAIEVLWEALGHPREGEARRAMFAQPADLKASDRISNARKVIREGD